MEILSDPKLQQKGVRAGATQDYLDIDEIRDGVVILKNGAMRAVVMCTAINFALKSGEEQEAIISAYQQFLNSLDFPVQIVVQSRAVDLSDYFKFLDERAKVQENELLKLQINEYRDFVKGLVEVSHIMSKKFFVVVPFSLLEAKSEGGVIDKFKSIFSPKQTLKQSEEDFQKFKSQLWQRVNHVIQGLSGMGINAQPLETQELIELYYSLYNPSGGIGHGKLRDVGQLDVENVVGSGR